MDDNIFKRLRMTKKRPLDIPSGQGKKKDLPKYLTQTELAKLLKISQQTVAKAEIKGNEPSLNTIKAYHEHFETPYSTLMGEGEALKEENVQISKELRLLDDSIDTIRNLSPISRSMLNAFLSKAVMTDQYLYQLAQLLYSMSSYLKEPTHSKMDSNYNQLKLMAKESFAEYIQYISFKDLQETFELLELEENQKVDYQNNHQEDIIKELEKLQNNRD